MIVFSIKDVYASLLGGAIAEISVTPICALQTLYSINYQPESNKKITFRDIVYKTYKQYGVRAFYRATFSGIATQCVHTSSKYTLYTLLCHSTSFNYFTNGMIAGIMSVALTQPFDVIKNYNQRQLNWDVRVYYRGWRYSVIRSAALVGTIYPLNDYCKRYTASPALAALIASLIATPMCYPLDLIKRRALAGERVWLGNRPSNYFRGLSIGYLRGVINFTVSMIVIDYAKNI